MRGNESVNLRAKRSRRECRPTLKGYRQKLGDTEWNRPQRHLRKQRYRRAWKHAKNLHTHPRAHSKIRENTQAEIQTRMLPRKETTYTATHTFRDKRNRKQTTHSEREICRDGQDERQITDRREKVTDRNCRNRRQVCITEERQRKRANTGEEREKGQEG